MNGFNVYDVERVMNNRLECEAHHNALALCEVTLPYLKLANVRFYPYIYTYALSNYNFGPNDMTQVRWLSREPIVDRTDVCRLCLLAGDTKQVAKLSR